jgi:hypothetical protein
VYKRLSEQYTTPSAKTIAELARKALSAGVYTNLITYMETMREIAKLQQEVGKELEGQVEPKLLEEYRLSVGDLAVLVEKVLGDGTVGWDEVVSVVEAQGRVCDIVKQMLPLSSDPIMCR